MGLDLVKLVTFLLFSQLFSSLPLAVCQQGNTIAKTFIPVRWCCYSHTLHSNLMDWIVHGGHCSFMWLCLVQTIRRPICPTPSQLLHKSSFFINTYVQCISVIKGITICRFLFHQPPHLRSINQHPASWIHFWTMDTWSSLVWVDSYSMVLEEVLTFRKNASETWTMETGPLSHRVCADQQPPFTRILHESHRILPIFLTTLSRFCHQVTD